MAAVRWFWDRLPWRTPTAYFSAVSRFASLSAPCLVREKTRTDFISVDFKSSIRSPTFWDCTTG